MWHRQINKRNSYYWNGNMNTKCLEMFTCQNVGKLFLNCFMLKTSSNIFSNYLQTVYQQLFLSVFFNLSYIYCTTT